MSAAGALLVGPTLAQDETPPAVTSVRLLNVGDTYFEVEWQTNEPAKGGIQYGRSSDYGKVIDGPNTFVTRQFLNVTGLTKGATYHYRVYAEDVHGNIGFSGDYTVTVGDQGGGGGGGFSWTWTLFALIIIVIVVYFLFIRPARD